MPAITAYEPNAASQTARAIEEAFTKEAEARHAAFAVRWQYYNGIMRPPLRLQSDGVDDNVMLPKLGQVIDKVTSFLLGEGVTFDTSGDEDTEYAPADQALADIWQMARSGHCHHLLALFGAICGHCFVRVEPQIGGLPRITALNPEQVTVFWDSFDLAQVLCYRLQYRSGDHGAGRRVDYVRGAAAGGGWDHDAAGWTERAYTIGNMDWQWRLVSEQRLAYCPIIDWQNLSNAINYYGQDEAANVLALNDALNFAASNYSRILKHYGTPRTIGLGFTVEEDVQQGAGDLLTINKPPGEADVRYLEMAGDLASVREWIAMLNGEIWQAVRMPDPQNLKDKIGALTNFGLRLLYNDALHKVADKRMLYGEGFERVGKLALALAGVPVPERVVTVWPDVLPSDDAAEALVLQQDLAAGAIGRQTYAERRGYDWEREQQRLEEEAAGGDDLGARLLAAFDRGQPRPIA